MPNLIEIVESICVHGRNIIVTEEDWKSYSPFAVNRALAQNIDTIMFAAEANKRPKLSKVMHYIFLLKSITKKKRYGKWAKKVVDENQEDIQVISDYYQISIEKARRSLKCLTAAQITTMREELNKGGSTKNANKKQ